MPNVGDALEDGEVRQEAPNEMTLRFSPGQEIEPATIAEGIRFTRAGLDGGFGDANDVTITPGFAGIGDNPNEVIVRFAENLPDDLYRIEFIGSGTNPLANVDGDPFNDGTNQTFDFELDLGAQVVSVVPQPLLRDQQLNVLQAGDITDGDRITLSAGADTATFEFEDAAVGDGVAAGNVAVAFSAGDGNDDVAAALKAAIDGEGFGVETSVAGGTVTVQGTAFSPEVSVVSQQGAVTVEEGGLTQRTDRIVVHFNEDTLEESSAENPQFYQLIDTKETSDISDDDVMLPTIVEYDARNNTAVLQFADIPEATYQLRIGVSELPMSNVVPITATLPDGSTPEMNAHLRYTAFLGEGLDLPPDDAPIPETSREYSPTSLILESEDELPGISGQNDAVGTAEFIAGFGTGAGDDPEADVSGELASGGDTDVFSFQLDAGDIFGANVFGGAGTLQMFDPSGSLLIGSSQDTTFIHPGVSPLPGGGNAALSYVVSTAGTYSVAVSGGTGGYDLQLRSFRPALESQPIGETQTLFIDFDGATLDASIFGGIGTANLSPLEDFLPRWGLSLSELPAVRDAIVDVLTESIRTDIINLGLNPNFDIEILRSDQDPDPFGQRNVSRVIVGGTIAELGIPTIGIAESVDVGNFETEETAVVLLDLLSSTDPFDPNSLNNIPLDPTASIIDLVGEAVGNIVAHEAGHFFANFHTDQFNATANIMDQGGNLPGTIGLGPDGIFGSGDDVDVDFGEDTYVPNEGFTGTEDTLNAIAFGLTTGTNPFTDDNSSFDTASIVADAANPLDDRELVISADIEPQPILLPPLPGGTEEPGHREIAPEAHIASTGTDAVLPGSITTAFYNFSDLYGTDPQGNPLQNLITENQKQRAREIFEIYSEFLGIEFVETENQGIQVVTGDLRAVDPTLPTGPGGVGGVSSGGLGGIVVMDSAENYGASLYGGAWFLTALHEIGHSLGLGHSFDIPSIMGAGLSNQEPVFPGDHDFVHARRIFRPDSTDIDLYEFEVAEEGIFTAEVFAERLQPTSLLNSALTLYDADRERIAFNDDYFSNDSRIRLRLQPGIYYIAVTSTGNTDFDPNVSDTGMNGTTDGPYQLSLTLVPDPVPGEFLVDSTGTAFDGDADGRPGGVYNFWFQSGETIFVDKANAGSAGQDGSLANPFSEIDQALQAVGATTDVIRIAGNGGADGSLSTPEDARPYLLGFDEDFNILEDGLTLEVPQGVTLMVGQGALFKMHLTNIEVGSLSVGIDRSEAALQVLGAPGNEVVFTSLRNDLIGGVTDGLDDGSGGEQGDWGGLVFRADSDLEQAGVFLNYVNHADIGFGGGELNVESRQQVFNPIHIIEARPTVSFSTIRRSADAAISADPNSFDEEDGRIGPDVHGNTVVNNSINGLFVRVRTEFGRPIDTVDVAARFDDTDIVHVVTENVEITGNPGGPFGQEARVAGRLRIDGDVVVKLAGSRIEGRRGASNFIAEGSDEHPIIFTSLFDDRFGRGGTFDTNNDRGTVNERGPSPGDWGGIILNAASRGSIDHAVLMFGGGEIPIAGGFDSFNVIEVHQADFRLTNSRLEQNAPGEATTDRNGRQGNDSTTVFIRGAQPVIAGNTFLNNVDSIISVNANALNAEYVRDTGRSTGAADAVTEFPGNRGPLVRNNLMQGNAINGMDVRGEVLTTESVWDDTDIVHVLDNEEVVVPNFHTFGGLRLQSNPNESLVIKLQGAGAGFTATGSGLDIEDRIGGRIQVIGQPDSPVVFTSLADDFAGAGFRPDGQPQFDTNGDGLIPGSVPGLTEQELIPGPALFGVLDRPDSPIDIVQLDPATGGVVPGGVQINAPSAPSGSGIDGLSFNGQDLWYVSGTELFQIDPLTGQPLSAFDLTPLFPSGSQAGRTFTGLATLDDSLGNTHAFVLMHDAAGADIVFDLDTSLPDPVAAAGSFVLEIVGDGIANDFTLALGTDSASSRLLAFDAATGKVFRIQAFGAGAGLPDPGFDAVDGDGNPIAVTGLTAVGSELFLGTADGIEVFDAAGNPLRTLALPEGISGLGGGVIPTPTPDPNAPPPPPPPAQPVPGDWRSILLDQFSHDRNLIVHNELENPLTGGDEVNGIPRDAQFLGELAPRERAADDNRALGFEVHGFISGDDPGDVDVYSFRAEAGTEAWIDIDRTNPALNVVVELVNAASVTGSNGVFARAVNNDAVQAITPGVTALELIQDQLVDGDKLFRGNEIGVLTGGDFYTSNPNDAGMRVILPGVPGADGTYFVRVRSHSPDLSELDGGQSRGEYQLQVRTRQTHEQPGSAIRFADIRYATNGIEALGLPAHSPLLGESAEVLVFNESPSSSQVVGNLLESDRAAIAVAGRLDDFADIDFYQFEIDYENIQEIGGVNAFPKHASTIFDIDYADGAGRANTVLNIFDSTGELILTATDSNVGDDRPRPLEGADLDDLSRGSVGALDPFVGNVELPEGTYFAVVSSNAEIPVVLDQFVSENTANALVRLEPINSLRRIAEDHIDSSGGSTFDDPIVEEVVDTTNPALSERSGIVPFHLGDVVLFTSEDVGLNTTRIRTIDPFTGALETQVGVFGDDIRDIFVTPDGRIVALTTQDDVRSDANTGEFLEISPGDASIINRTDDGILTFIENPANPGNAIRANINGANGPGVGIVFNAITGSDGVDADPPPQQGGFFAVGDRGDAALSPNGIAVTENILYQFTSGGVATSAPGQDRSGNALINGAGTQIVERGELVTGGVTLTTVEATEVLGNPLQAGIPQTTPIIEDGVTFTVTGLPGIPPFQTFEFDSGPDFLLDVDPDATVLGNPAPRVIGDGDFFFLNDALGGRALFQFDTGHVYDIVDPASIADGDTITIQRGLTVVTVEFDTAFDGVAGGNIDVDVVPGQTANQVAQNTATAFNNIFAVAPPTAQVQVNVLPGGGRSSVIPVTGAAPITVTVNSPGDGVVLRGDPNTPGAPSPIVQTVAGALIADGQTFDITDSTSGAPILRTFEFDRNADGVTAGNVDIDVFATDTAAMVATRIAAAINTEAMIDGPGGFDPDARTVPGTDQLIVSGVSPLFALGSSPLALVAVDEIIPVAETDQAGEVGQKIAATINPLALPGTYSNLMAPEIAFDLTVGTDGARLNFLGAPTIDSDGNGIVDPNTDLAFDFAAAPLMLPQLDVTGTTLAADGVATGNVAIPFLAEHTAIEIAQQIENTFLSLDPLRGLPLATQAGVSRIGSTLRLNSVSITGGDPPFATVSASGLNGTITGLARIGGTLFAVDDAGGLYRVEAPTSRNASLTFIANVSADGVPDADGEGINFQGLAAGPPNVENAAYRNTLFAIDGDGTLYAFDTQGQLQSIFLDGQNRINTGLSSIHGLSFANLDRNLWDTTARRRLDAGHGLNTTFDGSRFSVNGETSLYFGAGDYDFAGGAHGSIESERFSLAGVSAADQPTLYFNYFVETEDVNSLSTNLSAMRDAFRVFLSRDDGIWHPLATNNLFQSGSLPDEFDDPDPFDGINVDVQPVFDATGSWRQVRVDLSTFAGMDNLKLRFDFSTAGDLNVGDTFTAGVELRAIPGARLRDGDTFTIDATQFEFDLGFTLVTPNGAAIADGETFTVEGTTFEFDTGDGVGGGNTRILVNPAQSAAQVAQNVAAAISGAVGGVTPIIPDAVEFPELQNRINLLGATAVNTAATAVSQEGSVGAAGQPVVINAGMDRVEVRRVIQQAVADVFAIPGSGTSGVVNEIEPNSALGTAQNVDNPSLWSLASNPAITDSIGLDISTAIPHISIQGTGDGTFDFFEFEVVGATVTAPLTGVFDIDNGITGGPGDIDTELFLFDAVGNVLASNDDGFDPDGSDGLDSFIEYQFTIDGTYFVGVGEFDSQGVTGGIVGNAPDAGDTYTLHIAVEDHANNFPPVPPGATGDPNLIKSYREVVRIIGHNVTDQGPLGLTSELFTDQFGNFNSNQRGQNNAFEGAYFDDIIIGFAERGEMVTGAPSNESFALNPNVNPATTTDVLSGEYQLEIRRGTEFGFSFDPRPFAPPPGLGLLDSFDTNERLTGDVSLEFDDGVDIFDGQTFRLASNDRVPGAEPIVFEFDDVAVSNGLSDPGHVRIPFSVTETAPIIAARVRDTINTGQVPGSGELIRDVLRATAALSDGTIFGTASTSNRVDVFGNVAGDLEGGLNFGNVDVVVNNDFGDANLFRDRGHVQIEQNRISNVSGFGIVVDAAPRDPAGNLPHPGTVRNFPTLNNPRLAPGVTIENNIIDTPGQGGILISGDPNVGSVPLAAVPLSKVTNNTIFGAGFSGVVGIRVTENASPTLINNIVAATDLAIDIDTSSLSTVVGTTLFQNNLNNGTTGSNPILLLPNDPLFVEPLDENFINPLAENFIPAEDSLAIDSSLNRLGDRPSLVAVRSDLGIPPSDLFAPGVDAFGQLRVDDPAQDPPPGLGSDVFKDRGAVERADFVGPTARIAVPEDNGALDLDPGVGDVFVDSPPPAERRRFVIEFADNAIGVDDAAVNSAQFELLQDGNLLFEGVDYTFSYNSNTNRATFEPIAGTFPIAVYTITVDNSASTGVRDKQGNRLQRNRADGSTRFTITLSPPPTITLEDASVLEGDAGSKALVFTATLSNPSSRVVTVEATTADGTATTIDGDYTPLAGVPITFNPGQVTSTVTVTIAGDTLQESDETFSVRLSVPTNATIADGQAVGTILNDDPKITIDDVTIDPEGDAGTTDAVFTVTLSDPITTPVSLDVTTADGTATAGDDFIALPTTTLTFNPGDPLSQQVVVSVIGDFEVEADEVFFVNLSNVSGNAFLDDAQGVGTIADDDVAFFTIDDVTIDPEGDTGDQTAAVFTVTLSEVPTVPGPVTVEVATADGTATAGADYVALPTTTLTFNPVAGDPDSLTETVSVLVNGDLEIEGDETFFVNLSNPGGGTDIVDGQGVGTIIDDEPRLLIDDVAVAEGDSGTTEATFTVTLTRASADVVTVDVATANGTATVADNDYLALAPTTLSFNPGGPLTQTLTVTILGDARDEADETFFVNLSNPIGATLRDGQGEGTILNDDDPALSIDDVEVLEGNAGTTQAVFTVSLSNPTNETVTVDVASADGTASVADNDYLPLPTTTLTFTPGGLQTQQVAVTVVGDTRGEGDEEFFVNLSNVSGGTIADGQGIGTILGDDLPTLTVDDVTVQEGNEGASNFAVFRVTLSEPSNQPVSVRFQTADGSATAGEDYVATGGTLTFSVGGQLSQEILVPIVGDTVVEGDEAFFVDLFDAQNADIADARGRAVILEEQNEGLAGANSQLLATVTGDFDGDGREDAAALAFDGRLYVGLSDGSQVKSPSQNVWGDLQDASNVAELLVGDVNGDGVDDVLAFTTDGRWHVGISTGDVFNFSDWSQWSASSAWAKLLVGDFNADGRDDVAGFAHNGRWFVGRSTTSGFYTSMWTHWSPSSSWAELFVGDFNADGRDDIAGFAHNGRWWVGRSTTGGFATSMWVQWSPSTAWAELFVGDFNGDGRDDVAGFAHNGRWWVGRSTTGGFATNMWAWWSPSSAWDDFAVGDFDGDGRTDVAGLAHNGRLYRGASQGLAFSTSLWSQRPDSESEWPDPLPLDIDGDGDEELLGFWSNSQAQDDLFGRLQGLAPVL